MSSGGGPGEVTEAQVLELSKGLKLTTVFHVAAEFGGPLSFFDAPSTTAADLVSKHHCVARPRCTSALRAHTSKWWHSYSSRRRSTRGR